MKVFSSSFKYEKRERVHPSLDLFKSHFLYLFTSNRISPNTIYDEQEIPDGLVSEVCDFLYILSLSFAL